MKSEQAGTTVQEGSPERSTGRHWLCEGDPMSRQGSGEQETALEGWGSQSPSGPFPVPGWSVIRSLAPSPPEGRVLS